MFDWTHFILWSQYIMMCHCCRRIERIWISHWWLHVIFQIKIQTQITRMSLQSKIVEVLCHQSRSRLLATMIQQNSCRGPRVPWGAIIIGALRLFKNVAEMTTQTGWTGFLVLRSPDGGQYLYGGKWGWLTDLWLIIPWLMLCPPKPTVPMCPWPRSWTRWWKQGRARN